MVALISAPASFAQEEKGKIDGSATVAKLFQEEITVEDLLIVLLTSYGPNALEELLKDRIMFIEGTKLNLTATPEEVQNFIDNRLKGENFQDLQALFSDRALRSFIRYQITREKYLNYLQEKLIKEKKINITDQDTLKYYNDNLDTLVQPESVLLRIINVQTSEEAEKAKKRLDNGEKFEKVASEVNTQAQLKKGGGILGWFTQNGELPKPIEDKAFTLSEGSHSGVIKINSYSIIYVEKRKERFEPKYADIKEEIKNKLIADAIEGDMRAELTRILQEGYKNLDIKIALFKLTEEGREAQEGTQ